MALSLPSRARIAGVIAPLFVAAAVAVAPTAVVLSSTGPLRQRVALTVDGRSWRDVSPPVTGWIDDATFFDARHGWVVSEDCAAGKGKVARTGDGGRTWHAARFGGHSCSAGSEFGLDFADAWHGWIVDVEASGGFARLWRTTDGGRSWRLLLERLPGNGRVRFRTAREGWLGGYNGLYRSRHGGRQWLRIRGFGRDYGRFAPPRFFGGAGITAAVSEHTAAAFRTGDGGRHWQRTLLVPLPRQPWLFDPLSLSSPQPSVCWLTVGGRRWSLLFVTSDGGRSWHERRPLPVDSGPLAAIDGRTAVLPVFRRKHTIVLVTHDGGRSWRPR